MAINELQKKAVFVIIFVCLTLIILTIFLPVAEVWLKDAMLLSQMSEQLLNTSLRILKIVLWMAVVIAIVRFVAYAILRSTLRNSPQNDVSSLLKTVFSIIVYIIAFFIIFQSQYPDVPLSGLFTGSTILGIVVGLALQETLGNLFAGIAMQADQPFQVGDVISIQNRGNGVVESVSWRGVKIRTFQNKLLVISNSVLGKESIEVAPRDNLNARLVFFNTVYSASPARTAQLVRDAIRGAENVSPKMRPIVRIRDLGENGIDWEVKYWLENYKLYSDSDALVRERIWYVFQREKIDFAFPTRTILVPDKIPEVAHDEKISVNAERLSRVPIFAPLTDAETERLARGSKVRVYAPGEPIVRIGADGNSMFVIIRGSVKVQIPENNAQKIVNTLSENDFFGEGSLLTGEPRSATVVAVNETEVLQIRKNALKPILEGNPILVESICEIIEERKEKRNLEGEVEGDLMNSESGGVVRSIRRFFGI